MDPELRERVVALILAAAGGSAWILLSAWSHAALHLVGIQHGF